MDYSTFNEQNWDNLGELYDTIVTYSRGIEKKTNPVISYSSKSYVWPDFSLLSDTGSSVEHTVSIYNDLIEDRAVSPFILLAPHLSGYQVLHDHFSNLGIRQVGQWPLIYYAGDKLFPHIDTKKGFEVKNLCQTEDVGAWKTIAQKVLFQEGNLPVDQFRGKQFDLLLGYADDTPVATALIFRGEHSASVHMVAVLPEHRKNGYGQRIFLQAINHCRSLGYGTVFAQASQMGLKPWTDIGFEVSGHVDVLWKVGFTR